MEAYLRNGIGAYISIASLFIVGSGIIVKMEGFGWLENGKGFYYSSVLKNSVKEGKGIL